MNVACSQSLVVVELSISYDHLASLEVQNKQQVKEFLSEQGVAPRMGAAVDTYLQFTSLFALGVDPPCISTRKESRGCLL